MKKKKTFTNEQIVKALQDRLAGMSVQEVCDKHNVSQATFYKWQRKFGGMEVSDVKRLKELEKENRQLKQLLAEKDLDIYGLKLVLGKK